MSSANLSQLETAHRAEVVSVHTYRVEVDVSDARDPEQLSFPVTSAIGLTTTESQTWFDFIGEVEEVSVDGDPV